MTEGTGNGEMAQEDGTEATSVMGDEGDRCPICLSALERRVLAVPSCCAHLFCLRCILRWAEMVPSCPVDRRLFSVIYTRDPVLGFIRIPVKTKNSRTDLEMCHCKKEAEKENDRGLSSGRIKKLARMFPVRGKDVQKKCNTGTCKHNLRSFAVRKKKDRLCQWVPSQLKREPCGAWALDSYPACPVLGAGQSASLTRELAELVVDYEQRPSLLLHKHWRSELQEHVQQPATAALAADGLSWRSLGALEARSGASPLGFPVPGPAAVPLPVARWFAFQGKACAVSCTRGKEKKGTRTTGSKGLKGKTEKPPTRTTRNRAQELPPVQDPCSSQSSHSDSNSSLPNQSPDTSSGSRSNRKPAGKRKPRQVGKQEECLKRNTRLRRRALEDARSSPEECGDDDDDDEGQQSLCHQDDGEEGKEAQGLDSQVFNCEQTLSADTVDLTQDSGKNLCSNTSDHSSGQEDLKDTAGDTLAVSDDDTKNNSSEDEMEMVHQVHESDEVSLQIPSHQEIQNEDHSIVLDGDKPIGYTELERSSPESSPSQDEVELESPSRSTVSPNANQREDAEDSANAETVVTVKLNEGEPSEELDLSSEGYIKCQDIKMAEGSYEEEQGNEASPKVTDTMKKEETSKEMCEDNMEMVPMDCDSPSTSHGELQSESDKRCGSVGDMSTDLTSCSQASDEGKKPLQGSLEVSVEQKSHTVSRQRKSRFHSPSTTWSPKESKQERDRSRSKSRDNVSSQKDPKGERRRSRSRSRSRGRDRSRDRDRNGSWSSRHKSRDYSRDRENDRDGQKNEDYRRNRNRDRNSRRRSRTRSRSNSRSRSLPRNRAYGRSLSSECTEPGGRSPRRRDRWGDEEWRNTRESYQSRRHDQDKPSYLSGKEAESSNNGGITESSSPDQAKQENPDWVKEKMKSDSEDRGKPRGTNAHQWEDGFSNGAGDSWARGAPLGGWDADRRRGTSWNQRGSQQKGDSEQNRWQSRNACSSGTSNHSGNDSYSRFNENRLNRRPMEQEPTEHPVDRSGWSSASSWAVCRTLPADVQDYYSRRGRGSSASGGGWNRHNEEKSVQDTPPGEPSAQGNRGPQPPVTLLQRPQLSLAVQSPVVQPVAPLLPFPVGGHPQALKLPSAPFAVPHQVPLFLHPPMPLIQVPVTATQGLPPPPPPPPPAQQADSQSVQKAAIGSIAHGTNRPSAPLSSSLPKAPGGTVQGAPGPAQPSSTTQPRPSDRHHADTHVDSSKKEKKLQIQEKAIHEVKAAMKPYYQNKDITKEEYKEIVRKAVEKVCHSKSGEVNSGKVANLVKAYVEKYKHDRKNKSEDSSK